MFVCKGPPRKTGNLPMGHFPFQIKIKKKKKKKKTHTHWQLLANGVTVVVDLDSKWTMFQAFDHDNYNCDGYIVLKQISELPTTMSIITLSLRDSGIDHDPYKVWLNEFSYYLKGSYSLVEYKFIVENADVGQGTLYVFDNEGDFNDFKAACEGEVITNFLYSIPITVLDDIHDMPSSLRIDYPKNSYYFFGVNTASMLTSYNVNATTYYHTLPDIAEEISNACELMSNECKFQRSKGKYVLAEYQDDGSTTSCNLSYYSTY